MTPLSARRLVVAAVAVGMVTGLAVPPMACAQKDDNVTPRDCADRDNAEVCAP